MRAEVPERARERGITVIVLCPGQDLAALVREAVADGADALGMAGGDGSLVVVAAAAAAHGLPFICIPAGTRNHFALDLGVDRHDVAGALDAFSDGLERRIDVGDVNGRMFLNNVSLGIYGDAVRQPSYRDAKVRTLLQTAETVLGPSAAVPELHVVDDVGNEHAHPAILLVSNNPYALDPPPAGGTRATLDSGQLGIIVVDPPGTGVSPPARAWSAPRLEAHAAGDVPAGIDGEAVVLRPPLRFLIRPAALRVRISSHHPGVSPSGQLRAFKPGSRPRGAPVAQRAAAESQKGSDMLSRGQKNLRMTARQPDEPPPRSMTSVAAQRVSEQRGEASPWSTALHEVEAVDLAMYEAVARTPTPSLDGHLRRLSEAANYSRLWLGIAAAIALLEGQRGRRAALEGVVTIGVTSASVNLVAKSIGLRQRPDVEQYRRFASRKVEMPESWSFPSGHAASASAFSYAVGRRLPELAVPLTLLAGVVGYSRIHIGVHYPGDVAVGAMLGSGVAAMVASAGDRLAARRRRVERPTAS
jgi:diacylglycerol kinase family enzyme/membrane-associated phospholipid phosphatase